MSDIFDRKEIARRDCLKCGGNGYIPAAGVGEEACPICQGTGVEEKEVAFDFTRTRPRTPAELRHDAFGEPLPLKNMKSADEFSDQ